MNHEVDFNGGGETSCYAHLICPTCQIVLGDSPHRENCLHGAATGDYSLE